jgi:uncharacterized repeat protein (TIGR03803 family)
MNTLEHYQPSMSNLRVSSTLALTIILALAIVATPPASAQTYSVLYSFTGGTDGGVSLGALIRDGAGNLYGTTSVSGATTGCILGTGCGTVFKLTPSGQLKVLYTFTGGEDGGNAKVGLVRDSVGNLYGTADWGGHFNGGVAYEVPKAGGYIILHAFADGPHDGNSGLSQLIRDSGGNLYGVTNGGGTIGGGTVYKLTPSSGAETILYSFFGGTDGANPHGPLVRDGAGNFYATTSGGGTTNSGVVFKLTPSGTETVLYSFPGGVGGQVPFDGLVRDSAGTLYGTTYFGGPTRCCGVVFKLNKHNHETTLYSFAYGSLPVGGLVRDKAGNLYGTTTLGGAFDSGTLFKVDPSGNETTLYSFTGGADGSFPNASLILDSAGNLYGTASQGANKTCELGCGVVFKLAPH